MHNIKKIIIFAIELYLLIIFKVVQALTHMEDGFIHGNSDFRRKTPTYPAGY